MSYITKEYEVALIDGLWLTWTPPQHQKYLNDFPLDSFHLTNIAISTWNYVSHIGAWSEPIFRIAGAQDSTPLLFSFFSTLVLYTEFKSGANGSTFVAHAMLGPPLVLENVVLRSRH